MSALPKLSLVRRFVLIGLLVLLAGMALVGTWVGSQIESGVINGTGVVTNLYLDGAISPHLQSLATGTPLEDADRLALDRLLTGSHLGEHVVALKIWGRDGRIIYNSPDPSMVGNRFVMERPIAQAFAGDVRSRVVDKDDLEDQLKNPKWSRLIETFAPIRAHGDNSVLAVAGFYQTAQSLEQGVRSAQLRSWAVQGAVTLVMLILLATLVIKANNTIDTQQQQLNEKLAQLTALLAQNEQLHERVSRAAARTTALNERFLRHVATDLHDGPGQCLALASMRIESLAEVCGGCEHSAGRERSVAEDFSTVHVALQSALADLRAILRGLQLPEIEQLSVTETLRRAIDDHERKTGLEVALAVHGIPDAAPLPVRITLFRLLQESLANGFRHGGGRNQRVSASSSSGHLQIEVADDGSGFDPSVPNTGGHFGLDGMRERVQLLGGSFEVKSAPNQGTVIRASLPLLELADADA
jgi:signal transduction histidine kinase